MKTSSTIKCSWIRRYCIDGHDNHWADRIDNHFTLTKETRLTLMNFGPEKFNTIIKAQIPVISSMFTRYKLYQKPIPKHH